MHLLVIKVIITKMHGATHIKVTHYPCQILNKFEFFRQIFKKSQISYLIKIRPVAVELFYAGRQTGRQMDEHDETKSDVSQFCELA